MSSELATACPACCDRDLACHGPCRQVCSRCEPARAGLASEARCAVNHGAPELCSLRQSSPHPGFRWGRGFRKGASEKPEASQLLLPQAQLQRMALCVLPREGWGLGWREVWLLSVAGGRGPESGTRPALKEVRPDSQLAGAALLSRIHHGDPPPGDSFTGTRGVVCPGDSRLAHLQRGGVHGSRGPGRRGLQGRRRLPALREQGGVFRTAGINETGLQAPGRSRHFKLRQRRQLPSR